MAAIEISGLVKTFGHVRALDGLDLTVEAGEDRLLGGDPWSAAVELHRRITYVPGDVNLWPQLSGGEAIDLLGRLRGVGRRRFGGLPPAARSCVTNVNCGWVGRLVSRPRRDFPAPCWIDHRIGT